MSERRRLLGVDYGSVRLGLAVSDPERKIASPLQVYERRDKKHDAAFFAKLLADEEIAQIVVGLPVHTDGSESQKSAEARKYGAWLAGVTGVPVSYFDERFTTVEAEGFLLAAGLTNKRRKARRDRVAAQILLQSYLDADCPEEDTAGPLADGND